MTDKPVGYYQVKHAPDPFDDDEQETCYFIIVAADFWDTYQRLDHDGSECSLIPDRFYSLTESVYEHDYETDEEAEDALRAAGLEAKILLGNHSAEDGGWD